jgi:acyl-homoserine-lactone acylase
MFTYLTKLIQFRGRKYSPSTKRLPLSSRVYPFRVFQDKSFRRLLVIFSLILMLVMGNHVRASSPEVTELLWDTYGVPHIYGKDVKSLFRAFGWAQMHSHGNLLLRLYGQARGKAAEYWGETYLESDKWVRTMGVPVRARAWYDAQNSSFRNYLNAFAAGINAYAREHPELIDDEVEVVLPVSAADVLAHLQQVLHFTFVVNPQIVASLSQEWENSKEISQEFHTEAIPTPHTFDRKRLLQETLGSNGWAIAPSRSANGNAMLLANPHLPWSDRFLWYETQLTAPGIDAYGAALVGIPVLSIAFNDNLGWTHTVNTHDGWDTYELTVVNGGYQWNGKIQAFETETQTLKVKQADGTMREEPLIVRHSVHGPVVARKDDKAIALRVVGLDWPGALEQWWDMERAKNLGEFEVALKRVQIPMFTVLYADRDGHILHLFNGQIPVRSQGDFEYWSGIIPGNTSTTLWTETHPYDDLPRLLDPPSGWLQNANDPPWTTTFPSALNPDNYPLYMAPLGPMWFRPQHSARMLAEDEQISFEEMVEYKHSTRMELAERLLDELVSAARQQGGEVARRAANVLDVWDRKAEADSRGAVLFAFWTQEVDFEANFSNFFAIPWNEEKPLTTPDGLADPRRAVAALEAAAAKVEAAYGRLDVPWGEVFRLRSGDLDLPANGGASSLGIFRTLAFAPEDDGRFQAISGDSYVAAIEFSNPVRAMVLTSYGNATQPNSPHRDDQLKLFANKQLRPVWRSRQDITSHLATREVF